MTIGEVVRYIKAQEKIAKNKTQERASYDYILANLICRGFSIAFGSKESYPTIDEVYPELFKEIREEQKEKIKERKMELSALRFRQFAQSYNDRRSKEVQASNE